MSSSSFVENLMTKAQMVKKNKNKMVTALTDTQTHKQKWFQNPVFMCVGDGLIILNDQVAEPWNPRQDWTPNPRDRSHITYEMVNRDGWGLYGEKEWKRAKTGQWGKEWRIEEELLNLIYLFIYLFIYSYSHHGNVQIFLTACEIK